MKPKIVFVVLLLFAMLGLPMHDVSAQVSQDLSIQIVVPPTVIYGHRPFDVVVSVGNTTLDTQTYNLMVFIGGPAWGRESYGLTLSTGEIYWTECGPALPEGTGCRYWWRGSVLPSKTATFTVSTYSGVALGTFQIASVSWSTNPGIKIASANITVLVGSSSASQLVNLNEKVWFGGAFNTLNITIQAPSLTQFTTNVDSNCGIQGLPVQFSSSTMRTFFQYSTIVGIPETFVGDCIITAITTAAGLGQITTKHPVTIFRLDISLIAPEMVRFGPKIQIDWGIKTNGLLEARGNVYIPPGLRVKSKGKDICPNTNGCAIFEEFHSWTGEWSKSIDVQALKPGSYTVIFELFGKNGLRRHVEKTIVITK